MGNRIRMYSIEKGGLPGTLRGVEDMQPLQMGFKPQRPPKLFEFCLIQGSHPAIPNLG